jgi:ATP-dependent Clp protease ATP-binding subunit ClpA
MLGWNPADHGLTGVLHPEKRSATACQFERALREKVVGQDQAVEALVDL